MNRRTMSLLSAVVLAIAFTGPAAASTMMLDTQDGGSGVAGASVIAFIGGYDVSGMHSLEALSAGFSSGACEAVVATKKGDSSSPFLVRAAVSGQIFENITAYFFGVDPSTGASVLLMRYEMHNAVIRSVEIDESVESSPSSDSLLEKLTIIPASITIIDDGGGFTDVICGKIK